MTKRVSILAVALLAAIAIGLYALGMRHWGAIYLLAINLVAAGLVGVDKGLAKAGRWRVPEATMLGASLAGGSPLAWLAMMAFRHKTSKATYQAKFIAIAFLQAVAIGAWVYWRFLS